MLLMTIHLNRPMSILDEKTLKLNPPSQYGKGLHIRIPWDKEFYRRFDIVAILQDYAREHPKYAKRVAKAVATIKNDPNYIPKT